MIAVISFIVLGSLQNALVMVRATVSSAILLPNGLVYSASSALVPVYRPGPTEKPLSKALVAPSFQSVGIPKASLPSIHRLPACVLMVTPLRPRLSWR